MEVQEVKSVAAIEGLKRNTIVYAEGALSIVNSSILFAGVGNILVVEAGAKIVDSRIAFKGDNSIVVIRKTRSDKINLRVDIFTDSFLLIDSGLHATGTITISVAEHANLVIGKGCLFSRGCWVRNSDAHLIYDVETNKRLNLGRDMIIGDHVWVGQDVSIVKSPFVGSGAIIGMGSLVRSRVRSNAIYAGNPCSLQKEGVFWDKTPVQGFDAARTGRSTVFAGDRKLCVFDGEDVADNSAVWKREVSRIAKMKASPEKVEAILSLADQPPLVVKPPQPAPPKKKPLYKTVLGPVARRIPAPVLALLRPKRA